MDARTSPRFLYDFNSPYAYLAASRVDSVLPQPPIWQPVAFAFILRAQGRRPWSMAPREREAGVTECAQRAERYGLPTLRWPPGWPEDSYGLVALRAAILAQDSGRLRAFSHAAFARHFVAGRGLTTLDDVRAVAEEAGLDPGAVAEGVTSPEVKARLTRATDAAIAAGVYGVPSVQLGGESFWGDDQLETAAAAAAG